MVEHHVANVNVVGSSPIIRLFRDMKVGALIKHLTQKKWGIIIETMDWTEHISGGIYCHVLWCDEVEPFWVWNDIIKECKDASG